MNSQLTSTAVDAHYGAQEERAAPALHADLLNFLLARDLVAEKRAIDVGAGTGAWARRLLAAGAREVAAIEWGEIAFDDHRLQARRADLNRPGWADEIPPAELVTCIEVVEHIPNQLILLEGLRSLLAEGGKLLMTTPNLETPRARVRLAMTGRLKEFDAHGDPTHYIPIFIHPFTKLCASAGLAIREIWSSPEGGAKSVGLRGRLADRAASLAGARYLGDNLCFMMTAA